MRRVSIAELISQAGSGAAWIALVAIVYDRTEARACWLAAALVGCVRGAAPLPGPWVGCAGRPLRPARRSMVVSDLAAAAAFVGLAFADAPIALVALASRRAALAEAPFGPAANAQLVDARAARSSAPWATATRSAAIGARARHRRRSSAALLRRRVRSADERSSSTRRRSSVSAVLVAARDRRSRTAPSRRSSPRTSGVSGRRPHRRATSGRCELDARRASVSACSAP